MQSQMRFSIYENSTRNPLRLRQGRPNLLPIRVDELEPHPPGIRRHLWYIHGWRGPADGLVYRVCMDSESYLPS